jgi:putative DNA methylase
MSHVQRSLSGNQMVGNACQAHTWFCVPYGHRELWRISFTKRQLVALTTYSDLVSEVRGPILQDAVASGLQADGTRSDGPHHSASEYADAAMLYLAFTVDKCADYWSSICSWHNSGEKMRNTFGRQAIPMVWDYAEVNPFCDSTGNWNAMLEWERKAIEHLSARAGGSAVQWDAQNQTISHSKVISTDPPYYDNIGYADLSDFFYGWLRRVLRDTHKDLLSTVAVPKTEELIASPYRHGGRQAAEEFFLDGMTQAMHNLATQSHSDYPVSIYYAFKQSETEGSDGTASTGWETFLEAVLKAGFAISGTWPMRTELANRMIGSGTNALASSIVLVCRRRDGAAGTITRRQFHDELKRELPEAVAHLQRGNIAPVDLAQASIGPGMAVYTRHAKILDASGEPVTVRDALRLINQVLDEALSEQESDFDDDSRWALTWFEQFGFSDGEFGVADNLARAKNTSVAGMVEAGVVASRKGKVRLLRPEELPADWDPASDTRLTVWETVHHLIRVLTTGGEAAAAEMVAALGVRADAARELAYRLYLVCERRKRSAEALAYNALVQSWSEIQNISLSVDRTLPTTQSDLFE